MKIKINIFLFVFIFCVHLLGNSYTHGQEVITAEILCNGYKDWLTSNTDKMHYDFNNEHFYQTLGSPQYKIQPIS